MGIKIAGVAIAVLPANARKNRSGTFVVKILVSFAKDHEVYNDQHNHKDDTWNHCSEEAPKNG